MLDIQDTNVTADSEISELSFFVEETGKSSGFIIFFPLYWVGNFCFKVIEDSTGEREEFFPIFMHISD